MDRRKFLSGAAAVPVVAALPIVVEASKKEVLDELKKETFVRAEQGWPKLLVGDVVSRSELHGGFLLCQDDQGIDGMVVSSDDYEYSVALIKRENPNAKGRLFRHRR